MMPLNLFIVVWILINYFLMDFSVEGVSNSHRINTLFDQYFVDYLKRYEKILY